MCMSHAYMASVNRTSFTGRKAYQYKCYNKYRKPSAYCHNFCLNKALYIAAALFSHHTKLTISAQLNQLRPLFFLFYSSGNGVLLWFKSIDCKASVYCQCLPCYISCCRHAKKCYCTRNIFRFSYLLHRRSAYYSISIFLFLKHCLS